MWDTSSGQWQPQRLEHRDPRWFTFDRVDGRTPLLRTEEGDVPLQPYKFITTVISAKSGLPIRGGKYGQGASEQDKDTLFRAVQNIAGDCAAIMPASMEIEFIESKITGSSLRLRTR